MDSRRRGTQIGFRARHPEQSIVYLVAGWRPRAADLAFSALSAGCLVVVLALWLGTDWLLAIGVGWLMQAPLLWLRVSAS